MRDMTKREFLSAVAEGNVTDAVMEYAADEIVKLDTTNQKRREKPSKKTLENEPVKEAIFAVLGENAMTATDIAKAVTEAGLEISTQKASALARQLVDEGKAVASDVKIKGKGAQRAYSLAE